MNILTLNHFSKKIILFSKLILLLTFPLIIGCADSPRKISDEIIQDIFEGNFLFLKGPGGLVLYDSKFRITPVVYEHIAGTGGELFNISIDLFKYQQLMFRWPKNIKSFSYIDSYSDSEHKLIKTIDISESYYQEYSYLESIYNSFENFKSKTIEEAKKHPDYEIFEEKEFLIYSEIVAEEKFNYRVETLSTIEIVTICVYNTGAKWEVGAIYSKKI
jgi:hypothetical protein